MTLTDLIDKAALARWLDCEAEAAEAWWREYRRDLHYDWAKSAANPHKRTYRQFQDECLRSFGIKTKGTFVARLEQGRALVATLSDAT